jgi:transcriptional regulator with XRE-family HTH domain
MILRHPDEVGLLVRDRRVAAGLTQAALAAAVGSGREWVGMLEGGNPGAELGRVLRVFAALGIALDAVVPVGPGEAEDPRPDGTRRGWGNAWGEGWGGVPPLDAILGEEHAQNPGERPVDGDGPTAERSTPESGSAGPRPRPRRGRGPRRA